MYYYKARMYSPTLGRFMQTDPIGYGDGMNIYAYVGADPVNKVDPSGLADIIVPGKACNPWNDPRPFCDAPFPPGALDDLLRQWNPGVNYAPSNASNGSVAKEREEPQNGRGTKRHDTKRLPKCAQDFLRGRIASNPADIVLHDWSPFGSNSVTFDNDIYLTSGTFGPGYARHKFHEIAHTSQYARGYGVSHHIMGYVATSSHDNAPLEMDADDFAQNTYNEYVAQGLDKTCPF